MRNCDNNAANSCEGPIRLDLADFFAQRRWPKQHGSRTASASSALLRRENRSSQCVYILWKCSKCRMLYRLLRTHGDEKGLRNDSEAFG